MVYHSIDDAGRRRPVRRFGWMQPLSLVVNVARLIVELIKLMC